jgi:hypothetical protein
MKSGGNMAYFGRKLKYQNSPGKPFAIGDGENTFLTPFEIKKSEATYSRNTSSRNYPALSVRPGREADPFTAITTPNALGQRNNEYPHVLDGTVWKRWTGSAWTNVQTGLTSAAGKFLEFNTETNRYTILINGTNKYSWNGSSAASITDAPATSLMTVDDYRLYALNDSTLQCTAAGSVTDWTTADDADTITLTGMTGSGTAITSYNDTVICWGEQSMHVLFGNDPYDFELSDPMEYGCISNRSVIEHRGVLYFLNYGRYMRYVGGRPGEMSQKVKSYLEAINTTYKVKCVAGKHGRYIYLSIPYGSTATENNLTLEYDTELDNWYVIDDGYVAFVNIGEYFYGVDEDGNFYTINSGTDDAGTDISWSHITGVWNQGTVSQKKVLSDLWAVVYLPTGSTLAVSYSTTVDADDFVALYTFTASATEQMTRIQVPTTALQMVDWYRLKFEGTGPCAIHYLEENLRIKPR